MASDDNNVYLTQLSSLIQNSTLLLHQLPTNEVDWSSIVTRTDPSPTSPDNSGNNNKVLVQNQIDDDSEEESSDDENMFLGGGYSSSEDDDEPSPTSNAFATSNNTPNTSIATSSTKAVFIEDSIEYLNEEESTLLKRAKSVHSALLLSLSPQSQSTSNVSGGGSGEGRKFVEQLIADILSTNTSSLSPSLPSSLTSDNSQGYNKLVQTIAYLTSSKIINNNPINISRISNERWRKVCLTNGLLVVQYLIYLLNSEGSSSSEVGVNNDSGESVNEESSCSALDEWNVVILPLLFGNSSLFLVNDDLRDALLSLSSFSSSSTSLDTDTATAADDTDTTANNEGKRLNKCQATVNICQVTLQNAISSTTSKEDRELRQTYILVVCQVLICLYDGITSQPSSFSGSEELDVVRNGIHSTILTIIRGICYTTNNHNDNNTSSSSSQKLTLEALRPVTGMLLPKLYNDDNNTSGSEKDTSSGEEVDVRAVELWNEILKLLGPYSEEQKCCKNW